MKKVDVLIIGGSASGIVAAVTGKGSYPEKVFLVIRKEDKVLVPCGIPYVFGSLGSTDRNIVPDAVLEREGVDLKIGEVASLDPKNKTCTTADGESISFDKVVFATGSVPAVPGWLRGADLDNVFTIPKNKEYLDRVQARIRGANRIVVVGGGFIGVEIADELNSVGKDVTIVELLPRVLSLVFDHEISERAEDSLRSRGVKIAVGSGVKELSGEGKVSGVVLQNDATIPADIVILAMGYQPNTELARASGIVADAKTGIKVDEYMRTSHADVFAVGDCAEKVDFITRRPSLVMLASTACAEARLAGMNLYGLHTVKTFKGTVPIFSTAIGKIGYGAAGLTEDRAKIEGIQVITATFEQPYKHPASLPNTDAQMVKLIAARDTGVVLGGEVVGGVSTGELTNLVGFIVQNRMSVSEVLTAQIGTHPLLTAAPTAYPLIKAAEALVRRGRRE
ncbi:MAG: FAD-dependent oxidoreductase [Phycisphaerae bacterium]|nr:FAD-dependent oxidoreductase [Phycisphaerae bacterium]